MRGLHTTCRSMFVKSQAQPATEQIKPDLTLSDSCVEVSYPFFSYIH